MNWFLLSSLAGLASNGFNITNRTALKDKGDHIAYSWWFEVIRSTFFLSFVLFQPFPSFSISNLFSLVLLSLTELFSVHVFMKMHAFTELSISSIISRLRVVWSPFLAWMLIGERLTIPEYLGIITIFLGIAVVSSPKKIRADKGIKTALIFSFSSALLSTVLKSVTNIATTEFIVMSQGIIPIVLLPVLIKNPVKRIVETLKYKHKHMAMAGIFNIASSYLLVRALSFSEASKVVGLYQAMTIFSVFYGIVILKEKDKIPQKIIGTIIVILGIIFTVI